MPRAPSVRQTDIRQAIAALKAAGLAVARVEIHAGGVAHVIPGPLTPAPILEHPSDLDEFRARRNALRATQGS